LRSCGGGHPRRIAEGNHTCAAHADGSVSCWGLGRHGQLGFEPVETCANNYACATVPTAVPGIADVVALAAGLRHTCALQEQGTVLCWGDGEAGQLGPDSDLGPAPVLVPVVGDIVQLVAGGSRTCVLVADGTAECWGYELGPSPVPVPGLASAVWISTAHQHGCAVLDDTSVVCWGDNTYGKLGDGTTESRPNAAAVLGVTNAIEVAVNGFSSCALLGNDEVWCWGYNGYGMLGNASNMDSHVPVKVAL
jgi:alpha-tubulin suppressor-like RCC1 family protein